MPKPDFVVDTNIILDHLLGRRDTLIKLLNNQKAAYVTFPVWLETVYVLESFYHQSRAHIHAALLQLFHTQGIITSKNLFQSFLRHYLESPKVSPLDCYLLSFSTHHKLQLLSHDRKLVKKALTYDQNPASPHSS